MPRAGIAALFVLVFAVAGCGPGSGGPGGGEATKAGFVRQANAICNEVNEVLQQAMLDWFGPGLRPDEETGIRFTHRVWVPKLREQNRALRRLAMPATDRSRIQAMLDELDRATDRVEADPGLASTGPFDRVTRQLTAYGIGSCGSP